MINVNGGCCKELLYDYGFLFVKACICDILNLIIL